ncbi:MAG TPA: iron chelate uptake ABC transporter family permease subunit [Gemmataceae bacterium]|nr:iron chelate uptake ABC transporter family permease subunit [Gemmataceae bacterium]
MIPEITYNTLVVLVGAGLLGAGAGVIGSFAVLRRRALMGDALAHAALPGLCIAFLVVGEKSLPAMLFGAFVTGVLGTVIISALRRWTRIKEDAAIGIVLSVFFGAGVVLEQLIQRPSLRGSQAGLNSYILGRTASMILEDVYLIGGVVLLCVTLVLLLYKEFRLVAFDPAFGQVQGWPVQRLDLLLMGLIALAVVIGLPAVGVVLMAAMLILPAVAARFWTERLGVMLCLSAVFGLAASVIGILLSARYARLPAGPTIVLVGTTLFLASALFAPQRGGVARWLRQRWFRNEVAKWKELKPRDQEALR